MAHKIDDLTDKEVREKVAESIIESMDLCGFIADGGEVPYCPNCNLEMPKELPDSCPECGYSLKHFKDWIKTGYYNKLTGEQK